MIYNTIVSFSEHRGGIMTLKKKLVLGIAVFAAASTLSMNSSFAQDNFFGAVQVDDAVITTPPAQLPITAPTDESFVSPVSEDNTKLQDAMQSLESAQDKIRGELSELQVNYTNKDKEYKVVKLERKMLKNQIKDSEKRLKSIESAKKKIRKNLKVK